MSLTGKLALVTGASRGIGQAIALALGHAGATVAGTATSARGAEAISEAFAAEGIAGAGFQVDVADADSVRELLAAVTESFGQTAILVNNAGITRDNLVLRMGEADWDAVINTNLTSVYRLSKAVMRGMNKARWGRIINISSVVASMGNPGQVNYAAAKAGVEGLTRSMARELGVRGVTVNSIAPGFIETDMTRQLPEAQQEKLLEVVPLKRFGQPAEIAGLVCYLASENAGYITGETIHVNGGMYMG